MDKIEKKPKLRQYFKFVTVEARVEDINAK